MSRRYLLGPLALWLAVSPGAAMQNVWHSGLFRGHVVDFQVIDGLAILEGDIILGPAGELISALQGSPGKEAPSRAASIIPGERYRWLQGAIPYDVDPAIPNQERISGAIRHWNERTLIRLVPRSGETDYVRFVRQNANGVCFSAIGRTGGQQTIRVDDACGLGTLIHEIGHTVGLWHEQSRHDRDAYIRVSAENIDPAYLGNFQQQLLNGTDLGPYDYASIMHYAGGAFARGNAPSMVTIPLGIPIGQRSALSAGDIDAVARLYGSPSEVTVTTNPEGLPVAVDGETYISPRRFQWAPGSVHRLAAPEIQDDRGTQRLVFARWSHDEDREHTLVVQPGETVYLANYARQVRFRHSATPAEGGSVEVMPHSEGGWYPLGAALAVYAHPQPGYQFAGWASMGRELHGPAANPAVLSAAAYDYRANFSRSPLTTVSTEPPGIHVTVDGVSYLSPVAFDWAPGTVHKVVVAPEVVRPRDTGSRYLFRDWSHGADREHQITAGDKPSGVTARFRTQYRVSVQVQPRSTGAAELVPASPDGFYDEGSTLLVEATPAAPYKFSGWSGEALGANPSSSFTVRGETAILANFAIPRQIDRRSVFNAASLNAGPLCPGCALTVFGVEIGPGTPVGARLGPDGRLLTELGGTRVLVGGIPAPLLYASTGQVNALVPFAVAGMTSAAIRIETPGGLTNAVSVPLEAVDPALFTAGGSGTGQGAILNEDYTINSPKNPARRGSVIMAFGTGFGPTEPAAADGLPAPAPASLTTSSVEARLGGRKAVVEYAGAAPGMASGIYQVNVRVPENIFSGEPAVLLLKIGTRSTTRGVTVSVR